MSEFELCGEKDLYFLRFIWFISWFIAWVHKLKYCMWFLVVFCHLLSIYYTKAYHTYEVSLLTFFWPMCSGFSWSKKDNDNNNCVNSLDAGVCQRPAVSGYEHSWLVHPLLDRPCPETGFPGDAALHWGSPQTRAREPETGMLKAATVQLYWAGGIVGWWYNLPTVITIRK